MDYYKTALRYSPNFPEGHFFMGNALDEQGKLDEAVAEVSKVAMVPTHAGTNPHLHGYCSRQTKKI